VPRGICAACRKPIATTEAISLIDGNHLHSGEGYECLTAYGRRWRGGATAGLRALGLDPPPDPSGCDQTISAPDRHVPPLVIEDWRWPSQ
jgi:hypothetical protein